jgi:hypothetical protein
MRVRILKIESNTLVDGQIKERFKLRLPSISDGWRFNFSKQTKMKGALTYILITEETPKIIEGCLIYRLEEKAGVYIAYFEIAPHNRGDKRKYGLVAECLLAYSGKLSHELIEGYNQGWLTFDVMEEKEEDAEKLKALYCTKYGAVAIEGLTTMYINPDNTLQLMEKYLIT